MVGGGCRGAAGKTTPIGAICALDRGAPGSAAVKLRSPSRPGVSARFPTGIAVTDLPSAT